VQAELLLVLERPDIPPHNNLSERDIRAYVIKRKISDSTRSSGGRRCRVTFASLKKICRPVHDQSGEISQSGARSDHFDDKTRCSRQKLSCLTGQAR